MIYQKTFFNKSSGFTLIEVLITVVILSIGLLGMAGIQIQGLRGTTSSTVRSQATILANDIAERIRMNVDGLNIDGDPVNSDYTNVNIAVDEQGNSTIPCNAASAPTFCTATPGNSDIDACNAAQMAAFDIYEFACGLGHNGGIQNLLPSGSANISCNAVGCPPGSEVTIDVSWIETNTSGDPQQNGAQQIKTISMVIIP
jgi:type IV pilus assembly protein PilV